MNARKEPDTSSSAHHAGWFNHPVLSILLAGSWLVLSQSLAFVHLLSAVLVGLIIPRILRPFLSDASGLHWPAVPGLVAVVIWDILVSNVVVAKLVLGPLSNMTPGWIPVPLSSKHHRVNALFASIITTTPGTVSATIDEDRGIIWVHALNCDDAQAMAVDMKSRYEEPLLAIFKLTQGGEA